MANNGIFYSSGNSLNFTTSNTTWATLTSGGTFIINTVSGGTYLNLPSSTFTGGTITGPTIFTNGLTANTISATTYYNLPTDIRVTGGTYSAGTATFTNNTGGTFNVTGFSDFHYYISGSSPSGITLSIGDRWYNTNTGAEYVWNYDGNTYQWVQPAGTPGPRGLPGYSDVMVTTAITVSAETLITDYTYYGVVHTNIVNLTLPNPTGIDGVNLTIKDESGNASIYRIRLTSPVGNIDNQNYVDMNLNNMSLHLVARNNNWWII